MGAMHTEDFEPVCVGLFSAFMVVGAGVWGAVEWMLQSGETHAAGHGSGDGLILGLFFGTFGVVGNFCVNVLSFAALAAIPAALVYFAAAPIERMVRRSLAEGAEVHHL
jgi:hypothetical protein